MFVHFAQLAPMNFAKGCFRFEGFLKTSLPVTDYFPIQIPLVSMVKFVGWGTF